MEYNYHGPVVAFDLDDTLARERDYCRSGFRYLCDPVRYRVFEGEPYPTRDDLRTLEEEMDRRLTTGVNPFDPFDHYFEALASERGEEWNLKKHIEAYRNHIPNGYTLAEGVADTLNALSERGIRMAVITDGRSNTQRRKIEALGLDRFMAPEMILISGETGFEKTHSKEMYSMVVRNYPEASHFYYVGNNPLKDFYHPNLMGWTTIGVGPHPDDVHPDAVAPSELHKPQIQIERFQDLLKYLSP